MTKPGGQFPRVEIETSVCVHDDRSPTLEKNKLTLSEERFRGTPRRPGGYKGTSPYSRNHLRFEFLRRRR
ncbi:hypothetical protein L596_018137 [Steinernema carpocapsae]|uniref:Uncharacterized protein n=1 Tax=Steinernema carpocapsae TaxID=34508 RepID=A0A4U5N4I3_STECR|nr:hypothetical protein L596_018137 [Steinernema carpocapsae]